MFKVHLFRWILPALTGALYALALPPFDFSELGWVALIPLLFAIEDCRPSEAFRRGYIAGLVFFGATVWWIVHVTLPGMVALVALLALYFGAGAAWLSFVRSKSEAVWHNLLFCATGVAGWVTLEWVRGNFVLGGFGWNMLGVTQHRLAPLIQFASLTGVYGVSALVGFVNLAFFLTIRRFAGNLGSREPVRRLSWEFYLAMIAVCGLFLKGWDEIQAGRPSEAASHVLRVAFVQSNIPQTLKFDPDQKPMILERYRSLTESVILARPELILWPETATPEPMRYDPESFALVTNLAHKAGAHLLTGTIDRTPYASPPEYFNAAILVRPDAALGEIYRKVHLVPFGEYVPLHRWTARFLRLLGPAGYEVTEDTPGFARGREHTVFEMEGWKVGRMQDEQSSNLPIFQSSIPLRFGVVICFEDTLPEVYRQFVRRDVDFMINLTNDAWFKESPAAEMHLANAVFRCVETRRWLLRATNNGVTCAVDPHGYVRARIEPFTAGAKLYDVVVPAEQPVTFYTRHGDVFLAGCVLLAGLALLLRK